MLSHQRNKLKIRFKFVIVLAAYAGLSVTQVFTTGFGDNDKGQVFFDYSWPLLVEAYNAIQRGESSSEYIFSDSPLSPFKTPIRIIDRDSKQEFAITDDDIETLLPVILPQGRFIRYQRYVSLLKSGRQRTLDKYFSDLEEPYCIGTKVCYYFGFTSTGGGQIVRFETDSRHFQNILTKYEDMLEKTDLKKCRYANAFLDRKHLYNLLELQENSISLERNGAVTKLDIVGIGQALNRYAEKTIEFFYISVGVNALLTPFQAPKKNYSGSGNYLSLENNIYVYNGKLLNGYVFPFLISDRFVAFWEPDGAKFEDSLIIVDLANESAQIVGGFSWSSTKFEILGYDYQSDSEPELDVPMFIGANNHLLNLHPNEYYSAWIIETAGRASSRMTVYDPVSKQSKECRR